MVKIFSAWAIASTLAAVCTSAPSDTLPSKRFSFEEWARGIAENPKGNHLSPEEAMVAYNETIVASQLESRAADPAVRCNSFPDTKCYTPDAVNCVNFLARKGQQACRAGGAGGYAEMCRAAKCGFVTQGENFAAAPCNDVAITGGRILDSCTRGSNVQGDRKIVNQPRLSLIILSAMN